MAIGRAIVRSPKLFLFDEPLSNLDAALRVNTRIELAQLHRDLGAAMVYVTHDQVEAMTLADRIVVLHAVRVQQVGTPAQLYNEPANLVRRRLHRLATHELHRRRDGAGRGRAHAGRAARWAPGAAPTAAAARWTGRVRHFEYLGPDAHLFVSTEDAGELAVRVAGDVAPPVIGATIGLAPMPGRLLRFDEQGREDRRACVSARAVLRPQAATGATGAKLSLRDIGQYIR